MRAVILAAGFCRRMRPLTNATHKTLLKIDEETILERIIKSLLDNGITRITIGTGYKAEDLRNFMDTRFPGLEIQYVYNSKFDSTNNIYSLSLIFDQMGLVDEDIILIESDLIYDPTIIKRLIESPYENVALASKFQNGMDGTVLTVKKNIITRIIPPHLQDENFDFSDKYKSLNIYRFSKDFCNKIFKNFLKYYAQAFDDNCFYELVLGILIYVQQETIYAEIVDSETWAEIDDPNDLSVATFLFDKYHQLENLENNSGGLMNDFFQWFKTKEMSTIKSQFLFIPEYQLSYYRYNITVALCKKPINN